MIQSPQRWLSSCSCLNMIPQQVHSGSDMAVNAFTHSWQHIALSDRWASGNRSLLLVTVWDNRLLSALTEAGWYRRWQTRHLGGKIVSSNVCQRDRNPIRTAFLAPVFRCTPLASPFRFDDIITGYHRPNAVGRFHTLQLLRPPKRSGSQGSRAAGLKPKNHIFY